jgi:hypothetical protein
MVPRGRTEPPIPGFSVAATVKIDPQKLPTLGQIVHGSGGDKPLNFIKMAVAPEGIELPTNGQ